MQLTDYCPEWLPILREQEEKVRAEKLTAEDCLAIGLIMNRLAKEKYKKPCSFRIVTGGQTTFSYLMEGTDLFNEWWMDKKLNTCRLSGMSSMRTLVEIGEGNSPLLPDFEQENNFALCGGCFTLKNSAGAVIAYVLCSGMADECDHQLVVDALCEYLRVETGRIVE